MGQGKVETSASSVRAGEAETGSGGDQPDQGIAGRNSSRTMRRAWSSRRVLLPGLGADQRQAARSRPRVWFWIGPHRTDPPAYRLVRAERFPVQGGLCLSPSPEPDAPLRWRQCVRHAHWSITCHNGGLGLLQKPSIQRLLPPALRSWRGKAIGGFGGFPELPGTS